MPTDQRSLATDERGGSDAASQEMTAESAARGLVDDGSTTLTADDAPTKGRKSRSGRRRNRRKLRARRVERIVRRVDPWSVLKLTFLFYLCLWLILLLAGVILWSAASSAGAVDNIEDFMTDLFALKSFEFEGQQIFRGALVGGFILVLVGTGFSVLLSVLFNLIGDLTGGIRVSVIELENLRRRPGTPKRVGRGRARAERDSSTLKDIPPTRS